MLEGASLVIVAAVIGLVFGSFLNVVVYRLPIMLERRWRRECAEYLDDPGAHQEPSENEGREPFNLVVPASTCPGCGHKIRPWENIPILSYIALRGRCSNCGNHISLRYPTMELVAGLLAAIAAWHFGWSLALGGALVLIWTLLAAAAIDIEHYLLPDTLILPLLWLGLLLNVWHAYVPLEDAVIGAVAGYLLLWLFYQGFRLLTGKEGMGHGDFKLLACLGAWLGWQMLPLIVLAAAALGALIGGAWLLLNRHGKEHPIPFGPFLTGAGILALLAGPAIVHAYLHFALPAPH